MSIQLTLRFQTTSSCLRLSTFGTPSPAWAPDTVAARAMRRRPAALALASTLAATWIAYALVTSVRFSSGLARPDPECSSAQEVSICSHQLKGVSSLPLNTDGTDEATPPRDGSLAGMTAMWHEGITCFDVDGVLTSDGVMLATHPKRFADATGGARPAEMTLARARDAGADEAGFPTLDDVIAHFASLVEATAPDARPYWWRGDDSFARRSVSPRRRGRRPAAPPLTGPVLCLDLKGDALAPAHAVRLVRLADDLNVRGRVLVYVYDGGKDDAVLNAIKATKRPSVAVGLGRRDENPAHRSVSARVSRLNGGNERARRSIWRGHRAGDRAERRVRREVVRSRGTNGASRGELGGGRRGDAWRATGPRRQRCHHERAGTDAPRPARHPNPVRTEKILVKVRGGREIRGRRTREVASVERLRREVT